VKWKIRYAEHLVPPHETLTAYDESVAGCRFTSDADGGRGDVQGNVPSTP